MAGRIYTIKGRVNLTGTMEGVKGLRVEAWDKDQKLNDYLGYATTDQEGYFQIDFDESTFNALYERVPDVFFYVYYGTKLVKSTENNPLPIYKTPLEKVAFDVDLTGEKHEAIVKGRVLKTDGTVPRVALNVTLYQKQLAAKDVELGKSPINKNGYYLINYEVTLPARQIHPALDIFVEVSDSTKTFQKKSPIIVNAKSEETLDLTIEYEEPFNFNLMKEKFSTLFGSHVISTNIKEEDIVYIADKMGVDINEATCYVASEMLKAVISDYTNGIEIPADVFYAFARYNFPINLPILLSDDKLHTLPALLSQSREDMRRALNKAIEEKIITLPIDVQIDDILAAIKKVIVDYALKGLEVTNKYSLGQLIEIVFNNNHKNTNPTSTLK